MKTLQILLSASDSTTIKSIGDYMLNGMDSIFYKACVLAAWAGYALYFIWTVDKAIKNSTKSPGEFDRAYFIRQNLWSIIRDGVTIPFVVLFYPQLLDIALTWANDKNLVPDWLGKLFDTYNTTTVFTSFFVGVIFKIAARKARAWKYRRKAKEVSGNG